MSAEEDTELRDLIIQTLENSGVIGKIKAELRSSVFLALEEEGSFKNKIPIINKELNEFIARPEGKIVVSLIREFFEFFNLNFTLSVFDPEVVPSADYFSRLDLCGKFGLNNAYSDSPLLSTVINRFEKPDYLKQDNEQINKTEESTLSNSTLSEGFIGTIGKNSLSDNFVNRVGKTNYFKKDQVLGDFTQVRKIEDNVPSSSIFFDSVIGNPNGAKLVLNASECRNSEDKKGNKETKKNYDDPFYDELLPLEKKTYSLNKGNEQSMPTEATSKCLDSQGHSLKFERKDQEKCSSLSSLRDLPPLSSKNNELPSLRINKDDKKSLPSFHDYNSHNQEENYDEDDFHSSGSGHSTKYSLKSNDVGGHLKQDPNDNSEQSIEEYLEEDFSAGVDDLLNSSISLGDDATTDQTVSQISVIGDCDYVESCDLAKGDGIV